jgi:hypothetical protein
MLLLEELLLGGGLGGREKKADARMSAAGEEV